MAIRTTAVGAWQLPSTRPTSWSSPREAVDRSEVDGAGVPVLEGQLTLAG
jgi:hypothetical protein